MGYFGRYSKPGRSSLEGFESPFISLKEEYFWKSLYSWAKTFRMRLIKNVAITIFSITLSTTAFVSCTQSGKSANDAGTTKQVNEVEPIVYVDSDSLLSKYDYYKEVKGQMEEKGKKLQADVEVKGRSFQAEVQAYQKNAVNLTPDEKKSTEQRLGRKQQELQAYQQTLSQQLGQEEQTINQKLYDKVQVYLKDWCQKNHHKMVLTYSKGGNLLYGDKNLDVTSPVVKGLNDLYKSEKK